MDHLELVVEVNPSTSFLVIVVVLILGHHRVLRIDAVQVFKIGTVVLKHFAEYLGLSLFDELVEGVSIDKKSFFGGMGMQVEEKIYPRY